MYGKNNFFTILLDPRLSSTTWVPDVSVCIALFEPLILFHRVNRDFLFSATTFTDALLLDVPEPLRAVAIGVCAESFKDDEVITATFAF